MGDSYNCGTPISHPKMIGKPHGCWVALFEETPHIFSIRLGMVFGPFLIFPLDGLAHLADVFFVKKKQLGPAAQL